MKTPWIPCLLCLFTLITPTVLGSCGCTLDSLTTTDTTPWLTPADIATMQQHAKENGWTFTVGENPATQRPFSQLCGLVEPADWWVNASFDPCLPTTTLPDRWDWREHNGVSSVKDQDGCGSCWAFGTVGPMESAILIHDHVEVDLSEQWLVSCNQNHWGCNGGWYAHDYHQWRTDIFDGSGAVLEQGFPYVAEDAPCDGPYHHPYHLDSWKYVGVNQGVPSTQAIKNAIYTYGPVSSGVAVNEAFGAYTGGVFNNNSPANINHAVTLVGWDDTLGEHGCWILKNSWGPYWGENGFMYIEYGCCKVGYAAAYVVYPPKTGIEIHGGPLGLHVHLYNPATTNLTQLKWTIMITGGRKNDINLSFSDTIDTLTPGQAETQRIPLLALGKVQIQVHTTAKNAGKQTVTTTGLLLGFLLIVNTP